MAEAREAYYFTWSDFGLDELCGPYKNIDAATTSMKRWRNHNRLDARCGVLYLTDKQVSTWPKKDDAWPVLDDEPIIDQATGTAIVLAPAPQPYSIVKDNILKAKP